MARKGMSSAMVKASRLRLFTPEPMSTILNKPLLWWMLFRPLSASMTEGDEDQMNFMLIMLTMPRLRFENRSELENNKHYLNDTLRMPADWVSIAPSSKLSLPDSSSKNDSESDMRSATTPIRLSSI
jgi:hypothetical protein